MSERMRLYNDLCDSEERCRTAALDAKTNCERRVLWKVQEQLQNAITELRDCLPDEFVMNTRPSWYD